jgi:hypothetical protein
MELEKAEKREFSLFLFISTSQQRQRNPLCPPQLLVFNKILVLLSSRFIDQRTRRMAGEKASWLRRSLAPNKSLVSAALVEEFLNSRFAPPASLSSSLFYF